RAGVQYDSRRGCREAPGRQGRFARRSGRRHPAGGRLADACVRPLPRVLERRRPRRPSDRGRLRLQGQVTLHELVLPTIARWLGLLALAVLIGGLVVDLFVLPRGVAELARARESLRRWTTAAVVVLILTSAANAIARARIMSGGDFGQAMAAL